MRILAGPFERFIDETRSDFPDIDIDFPDTKRDKVFDYLKETYGAERVARLGTISKFAGLSIGAGGIFSGKAAINDTAKALGIPQSIARDIGRAQEITNHVPIGVFFDNAPDDILPLLEKHPEIKDAALLDEVPRHHGVHAAGVVVTHDKITNYGSVRDGVIAMDMVSAEKIGLLKMDALGLRTLSVIADTCMMSSIKDPYSIIENLADPKVFDIFNKDLVTGVFQFEGQAVRNLMKGMSVDNFNDLCALTSLVRPGPLVGGATENYVKRRSGTDDWKYLHAALEPHTKETFGTIVYQEQAMSIVRDIGKFDVADVNRFRKAVGKKDPAVLASFQAKFVAAAQETIGKELAHQLWDEMCEFGSYAFNKSHAVAYSMISYMTAYLKAYHPLEFAVAQLSNAADEDLGQGIAARACERGIQVCSVRPSHVGDDLEHQGWRSLRRLHFGTRDRAEDSEYSLTASPEAWGASSEGDRLRFPPFSEWTRCGGSRTILLHRLADPEPETSSRREVI